MDRDTTAVDLNNFRLNPWGAADAGHGRVTYTLHV